MRSLFGLVLLCAALAFASAETPDVPPAPEVSFVSLMEDSYAAAGTRVESLMQAVTLSWTNGAFSGWLNDWAQPVEFKCPKGQVISGMKSHHHDKKEDRQYAFKCATPSRALTFVKQTWTDWLNKWDAVVEYTCPKGGLLTGAASEHHNGSEDRRFKFQCSFTDNTVTVLKPTWSAFLNNFDQPLDYTCPKGQVMVGQYSVHGNGVEDRRFKARCAEIKHQHREEACEQIANDEINTVKSVCTGAQKILNAVDTGKLCAKQAATASGLDTFQPDIDKAQKKLDDLKDQLADAKASKVTYTVDFEALKPGKCEAIFSSSSYLETKSKVDTISKAVSKAEGELKAFQKVAENAKSKAADLEVACLRIVRDNLKKAFEVAKKTCSSDAQKAAYARAHHMKCVLKKTDLKDCTVGDLPDITMPKMEGFKHGGSFAATFTKPPHSNGNCFIDKGWLVAQRGGSCMFSEMKDGKNTPITVDWRKKKYTTFRFKMKMYEANAHNYNISPHGGFKPCNNDNWSSSRGGSPEFWFIDRHGDWGYGLYNGGFGHSAQYTNQRSLNSNNNPSDPQGGAEKEWVITMERRSNSDWRIGCWSVQGVKYNKYHNRHSSCRTSGTHPFTPRIWSYSGNDKFMAKDFSFSQNDEKPDSCY